MTEADPSRNKNHASANSQPTIALRVFRYVRNSNPRARILLLFPIAVSFLVFVLSLVHLFNIATFEDMAQAKVIAYMQKNFAGPLKFSPDIKIVLVPENRKDGPAPSGNIEYEHRMFFAKLVRAMTEARAKVVAFDITFAVDSEWDKDFGAAIAD